MQNIEGKFSVYSLSSHFSLLGIASSFHYIFCFLSMGFESFFDLGNISFPISILDQHRLRFTFYLHGCVWYQLGLISTFFLECCLMCRSS